MSESHGSATPAPAEIPLTAEQARAYDKDFKGYVLIGALQMVFTLVTVALSFVQFSSRGAGILVTLLSASVNAGMVAFILMHLKGEKALIWKVLVFTAIFMVVLFGLTLLTWSDPILGTTHTHH